MQDPDDTDTPELNRERRARREARRQGFLLQKSRCRTPRATEFGGYLIVDPEYNAVVAGGNPWAYSMGLDDVEGWLWPDSARWSADATGGDGRR